MSISRFALAEVSVAQAEPATVASKTPAKRQAVALADAAAAPEPR